MWFSEIFAQTHWIVEQCFRTFDLQKFQESQGNARISWILHPSEEWNLTRLLICRGGWTKEGPYEEWRGSPEIENPSGVKTGYQSYPAAGSPPSGEPAGLEGSRKILCAYYKLSSYYLYMCPESRWKRNKVLKNWFYLHIFKS